MSYTSNVSKQMLTLGDNIMIEVKLCECECGEELFPTQKRFKHGHNRKGLISCTTKGRWAMKYDCCQECGTVDRKHQRDGLCTNCARRALYHGKIEKKRQYIKTWSRKHIKCIDCGTKDRPHHGNGRCARCHMNNLNRQIGIPKKDISGWAWYHKRCRNCKTKEIPHAAYGLCDRCYLSKRQKTNNDKTCPVCTVPINKLFQHISMMAKSSKEHKKYLEKQELIAKELFYTDKTSQELSEVHSFGKRFILKTWHKYLSDEEIIERGEKIRISKIQGEFHYLHGKPFPAIQPNITEYKTPTGEIYKMKSSWEVKLASLLDKKQIKYLYEPKGFSYLDSEGTERYYWPDFYLSESNVYVEVKGFMDKLSKWKIQSFKKNYPNKRLIVIRSDEEINEEFLYREDLIQLDIIDTSGKVIE